MALTMLSQRTVVFCRTFKGISSTKPILSLNTCCGFLLQTASYNPKRLWLNLKDVYIPDKDNEKTPEWLKTAEGDRKRYGRHGSASGVDPASLWPSHDQLEEMIAEENEWNPSLEVMLKNIEIKEKAKTEERLAKEKLIAENMAKMPKMVEEWRRQRKEAKQKLKEEKARKQRLLEEARERFDGYVDHRSPRFLEMVAEIEKEEKKKMKLLKRKLKEEAAAAAQARPAAPTSEPPV